MGVCTLSVTSSLASQLALMDLLSPSSKHWNYSGCYTVPTITWVLGSSLLSTDLSSIRFSYWAVPLDPRGFFASIEGICVFVMWRKYLGKPNLRKRKFISAHSSKAQSTTMGNQSHGCLRQLAPLHPQSGSRGKMLMPHWPLPSYRVQDPSPRNSPADIQSGSSSSIKPALRESLMSLPRG